MPQPDAPDGAEQAQWNDEDNGQRQTPAFILRGQREEHEQHAERKYEHDGVARQNFLVGQICPFVAHAGRQFFGGEFLRQSDGLSGADTRVRDAIDVRSGIHVVANHFVRASRFMNIHQRTERNHVAGGIAGFKFPDVVGVNPEICVGLGRHLICPAKAVEVIYVKRAQINL